MNNILQQLYVQGKDRMVPIYVNNKHIEVNNLFNVTEEFLNENYSKYAVVIDKGNGNVYEQYEVGKWSGIKQNPPTPGEYVFASDKSIVSFDAVGGSDTVSIISSKNGNYIDYNVSSIPDWILFNNGNIVAYSNTSDNSRSGNILLIQNESGNIITITVQQAGASEDVYELNVVPYLLNVIKEGESKTIEVTSIKNSDFILPNIESKPDWITIENTQIINNMIRYGLTIAANPASESRSGTIIIKQTESNKTVNVVVSQSGASTYVFSISQSTLNVGPSATSHSVFLTSTKNGATQGFSVDASSDWITPTIIGGSSGHVTLQIAANATTSQRSGFVRFIQNESGNTCSIDVIQTRANSFEILTNSPLSLDSGAHGPANTYIRVQSIVNGEASAPFTVTSAPSWITSTEVDLDMSRVLLTIPENQDTQTRTGTLTLTQTATGATASIIITQVGDLYVLSVEPSTINVDSASHNVNIDITSERDEIPIGATITDCPPWITYNLIQ